MVFSCCKMYQNLFKGYNMKDFLFSVFEKFFTLLFNIISAAVKTFFSWPEAGEF